MPRRILDGWAPVATTVALITLILAVATGQAQTIPQTKTSNACCTITAINGVGGIVTAQLQRGRSFQFQANKKLLPNLQVGQKVYADFPNKKVSLDGVTTCCDILPQPTAGSGDETAPAGGWDIGNTQAQSGSLPTPNSAVPCCDISAIDAAQGLVTAQDPQKGSFQFAVDSRSLLSRLKIGQKVYADFATKKVSVDGAVPCCEIVSIAGTPGIGGAWEIAPNATLRGSTGRLVVEAPSGATILVQVFRAGGSQQIESWYSSTAGHLRPGVYDVKIWDARLTGVPIEQGKDTRIRLGALDIPIGSPYEVFDESQTNRVFSGVASEKSKIVLPVGRYFVKAAGNDRVISIKDRQVTAF